MTLAGIAFPKGMASPTSLTSNQIAAWLRQLEMLRKTLMPVA